MLLLAASHRLIIHAPSCAPHSWLALANPKFSDMISKWIECDDWLTNMDRLRDLQEHVHDPEFHREWHEVRRYNKVRARESAICAVRCGAV